MKHVKTLNTQTMNNNLKKSGCGECQTSCQSACRKSDLRTEQVKDASGIRKTYCQRALQLRESGKPGSLLLYRREF